MLCPRANEIAASSPRMSLIALTVFDSIDRSLQILLSNGSLAVYEAFPSISAAASSTRPASLGVRFVKVVIRRLPTPVFRRPKPGVPEVEVPRREFVRFSQIQGYAGVFVTGEDPLWLVASDHGPARLVEHSEKGIFGFSQAAFDASDADFVMQTRTVSFRSLLAWPGLSKADVAVAGRDHWGTAQEHLL